MAAVSAAAAAAAAAADAFFHSLFYFLGCCFPLVLFLTLSRALDFYFAFVYLVMTI